MRAVDATVQSSLTALGLGSRRHHGIIIRQKLLWEIAAEYAAVWNRMTVVHDDKFHHASRTVASDISRTGATAQHRIHCLL